ncbi:aldehyde dehydrogenase [Bartonella clarridgeiae 73]|uniref:aldehyde dehydrogenase (NAD(+)) n=1 Tax=Bartonella clarridgeiae (strain CCUG 45776 / CIP 104772 / 73) TaxID=696125 RepID=E6YGC2_BARC7|nr:aldehyde dehydrogenase family protein [Bartonella clarridgeiae]WCR55483.1 MAG: Aldehyde dehydrogenase [Bartonella clarridgeiae]CBI75910.1 aldehyde dehydrogenase [Bartonella clarridgeiae 73]
MLNKRQFYINGLWENPNTSDDLHVINPSTEEICAVISVANIKDIDKAITAAKNAFQNWKKTVPEQRLAFVEKILEIYEKRSENIAKTISMEMGAPIDMARNSQTAAGSYHIRNFIKAFKDFSFQKVLIKGCSRAILQYDSIGVVGLITPWNWPMNQITLKVIPALLAGCTMILKPSELAPLSAMLFAEILDEAALPAGVFNLINGDGANVGSYLSSHPDLEMISFTGSTRAGKAISKNASNTLKRVCLELGGKGANLIFADADADALQRGVNNCFHNSGQSCNAPTRMLVEHSIYKKAITIAKHIAEKTIVGPSYQSGNHIGPVVSKQQYDKIQALIQSGIDEGATLVAGGIGLPTGMKRGYYIQPTVFADVKPHMRIFREEIFGPVLSIISFNTEEEAIALANNTEYGLTNYIQSQDRSKCQRIATQLRSGMVEVNGYDLPDGSYFGGVKQSGRAREGGRWGIEEFLDTKAISYW